MADVNDKTQMIQPNSANTTPVTSPRVFSMPARYRHGAVVNVVEPQKQVAPATAPTAPAVPLPPRPVPPPMTKALSGKSSSHSKRALLISGIVVLIALGISGYLLFRSFQKNIPVPAVTPPVEVPVVTPPIETPPEITPTPIEPVTGSVSPFSTTVTPGVDSDSDGLTDVEETIVYGTDPHLPDTDGDGFLDGNEVFHRYNPNGTAPADLLGAKLVQLLEASSYGLSYPMKWTSVPSEKNGYVISTTTGEQFSIESVAKDKILSLADWYSQTVKEGTPTVTKSKNGFPMLVNSNQLTAHLDLGTSILTFTYETAAKNTIDYLQTFQMMLNSVELKK